MWRSCASKTTSARPGCRMQIRSLSSSLTGFFVCDYLHHLVRAIIYFFPLDSILTIRFGFDKSLTKTQKAIFMGIFVIIICLPSNHQSDQSLKSLHCCQNLTTDFTSFTSFARHGWNETPPGKNGARTLALHGIVGGLRDGWLKCYEMLYCNYMALWIITII